MSFFTVPPKQSKALRIVNPETGTEERPVPTPPTNMVGHGVKGKSKHGAPKPKAKLAQVPWVPPPPGSTPPAFDADEHYARGFDVYAPSFVPTALRQINECPGTAVDTFPKTIIDYFQYISGLLPTSLLPALPRPTFADNPSESPFLSPQCYEKYFRSLLEVELGYQRKENASYSLYGHTGLLNFNDPNEPTVTITVPGLRENTPNVEVDDEVQLRQLRFDYGAHSESNFFPWTGYIYNARVSAVVRATETLVLRVGGITHHTAQVVTPTMIPPWPTQFVVKFNIQFLVPMARYTPMIDVLPHITESLDLAEQVLRNDFDALDSFIDEVTRNNGSARPNNKTDGLSTTNVYWKKSMLFPTEADCNSQTNIVNWLEHYNSLRFDESLNYEQRIAVDSVLCQNYGTMPYLISGPPGTGKTKTMIEIALQLVRNVPGCSHILVCAPSEPAADTLADRLSKSMNRKELFRLNRPTRDSREVLSNLLPYCYIQNDVFALPPFAQLMSYRIIVTSCRDASMLMYARLTNSDLYTVSSSLHQQIHPTLSPPPTKSARLHWSALLIDEAAQAMEPEALIPLHVVSPPLKGPSPLFTPLVIMAGDEQQLNPRTSCPCTPLQQSLFARLFKRPVYSNHPLARRLHGKDAQPPKQQYQLHPDLLPILRPPFTNLIRNYRSHPAILAMPSQLFYFDTLVAEADEQERNRLEEWAGWRGRHGRRWPILYHDNRSPDDLEAPSLSSATETTGGWFNIGEAHLACQYAASLFRSGLVMQKEICIMSPFKAQVRLIRSLIRSEMYGMMWEVNVGPTEAFQGLEHGVVILCVTRSRKRFVERDRALGWGVLPGRTGRMGRVGRENGATAGAAGGGIRNKLNVALTRAKFGLIILGSREVMMPDKEEDQNSNNKEKQEEDSDDDDDDNSEGQESGSTSQKEDANSQDNGGRHTKKKAKQEKEKDNMKETPTPCPKTAGTKGREEEEEGTEWAQIIAFCDRNGCIADSNPVSTAAPAPALARSQNGDFMLTNFHTAIASDSDRDSKCDNDGNNDNDYDSHRDRDSDRLSIQRLT
ncbi:P-loop containing nucleoside triphosphate hydrolase protein [Pseudoneurospora amorphoporcata]|uniref:P-loop containing nucleoside triphosphate hydrolase protein n=1 Tax=Pseudoneurospora amorphoporcata TaxID=241081 RepID=A0AAN6NLR6_9PEZI|nr:P-loop containing nucleoside triphosphate hydrolase protein [Pseudoneurospora amorphoporcata]